MTKKLKAFCSVNSLTIGCVLRAASTSLFLRRRATRLFGLRINYYDFFLTRSVIEGPCFLRNQTASISFPVECVKRCDATGAHVGHIYYPESCMDR